MPYPVLFMAAAGTTSSSNTIAGVVVTLASMGALIGGYTCYSAHTEEDENKQIAREQARRARYERDRYIREHANDTARFVSSETPPLIAAIQNNQRQFSELVTELTRTINQGEQGNEALQNLIPLMIGHLSALTTLTSQFEFELPTSHQRLMSVTSQLTAATSEFTQNQTNLSQVVEDISQTSSQLRRAAELVQLRSTNDPTQQMVLIKQQNRDYKTYIEKLIERVEEQSKTIKDLEAKLEEKQHSHPNRIWTDGRVFKKPYKGISPDSKTSSSSSLGKNKSCKM